MHPQGAPTQILSVILTRREDIFTLCDRCVVLCEGGRVVFEGPTGAVPAYLKAAVTLDLCCLPKV